MLQRQQPQRQRPLFQVVPQQRAVAIAADAQQRAGRLEPQRVVGTDMVSDAYQHGRDAPIAEVGQRRDRSLGDLGVFILAVA